MKCLVLFNYIYQEIKLIAYKKWTAQATGAEPNIWKRQINMSRSTSLQARFVSRLEHPHTLHEQARGTCSVWGDLQSFPIVKVILNSSLSSDYIFFLCEANPKILQYIFIFGGLSSIFFKLLIKREDFAHSTNKLAVFFFLRCDIVKNFVV